MSFPSLKSAALMFVATSLAACAARPSEIGRAPSLSPIGAGLKAQLVDVPIETEPAIAKYRGNSFWDDRSADLFKDPRARRVGDVLTVKISIEDDASLDNSSSRSRDAKHDIGLNLDHGIAWRGWESSGSANLSSAIDTKTEHDGKGTTARSERVDFMVAAIVTNILPNGNLVISGTQEVRVNFELRVVSISGVLDPRDITSDNVISYERIAEARISYGGRGRIMEVQQPGWGHQIVDNLSPF